MNRIRNQKRWEINRPDNAQVEALARLLGVSVPAATVFMSRGLDSREKAEEFRNGSAVQYDPFLLPDMGDAVDRIIHAFHRHEQILIHGDADCDGICSTALLVYALQALTGLNPFAHIPNRLTDGFGLSVASVERASERGIQLIITVDCGTEAFDAADRARELGIDLIITDHHVPKDRGVPTSIACVNPHRKSSLYPFSDLAGVGVAYKLIEALSDQLHDNENTLQNIGMPLVALGTIGDCVPLVGENRLLVIQGLKELDQTYMPGMRELIRAASIKTIDTEACGYFLAPALNSSCRLGCPEWSLKLLLETEPRMAKVFANHLKELNDERKSIQLELEQTVFQSMPEETFHYPFLLASGDDWHPGLVGLIASKLAGDYSKPSFVVAVNSPIEGMARGSCRSIPGLDILAALESCSDLLTRHGGHAAAGGFELPSENVQRLERRLFEYFDTLDYDGVGDNPVVVDADIPFSEITMRAFEQIEKLSPFGMGNQRPIFATGHLQIATASTFGKDNRHLKMMLTDAAKKKCIPAIYWSGGDQIDDLQPGCLVAVAHSLTLDTYRSKPSLMLTVHDWCYHGPEQATDEQGEL